MSKKKYTEEQINFVKDLVEKGSEVTPAARLMCEHFGMIFNDTIGRKMRDKMQKMKVTNNVQVIEDTDVFKEAQNKQHDTTKKRFLISWAQSETPIHKSFLKNMESYAEEINAEILILAGRYKNPTSLSSSENIKTKEKNLKNSWDVSILPYLDANRHNLHKHLVLLSNVKIQPTSSMPLTGLNGITGLESCIVGSPRVQLKSLPVVEGYPNKLLVTTGAITLENYTDTAIGAKSSFHHQIGCLIVELDGDTFHLRHITADKKGNFYDLMYCAKDGEISVCGNSTEAIVFGDLHICEHNPLAVDASFKLAEVLSTNKIIIHDAINSHSISHHEKRDPFQLLKREEDGTWSLKKEIDTVLDWFRKYPDYDFVTVRSNHCEFIDRWLCNEDWRKSPNKFLYLKFANVLADGKAPKGIVPYLFETELENVYPLGIDESYNILGWEVGIHGHLGVHGSRSSPTQLKGLPIKNITGHSHVPNRVDGALCVGTLTHLRVGYNKGASGWLHSNVIIYKNGKATNINIINGKFTTLI
jgi:hypothetical protein